MPTPSPTSSQWPLRKRITWRLAWIVAGSPGWLRYAISDFAAWALYWILRYRKNVINANFSIVFPDWDDQKRDSVRRKFYQHFCDLIVEQLWSLRASKADIVASCKLDLDPIFERCKQEGRPIMIAAAHYNNYELGALSAGLQMPIPLAGIYARLVDRFYDEKVLESRSRLGMMLWPRGEVAEKFAEWGKRKESFAVAFAFDQSPHAGRRKYWLPFFDRVTAFELGIEAYAKRYQAAVIYITTHRISRGRYRMGVRTISENAAMDQDLDILSSCARILEEDIRLSPEGWMWSHRRWKLDLEKDRLPNDRFAKGIS